ncbi:MAG TPA: carbohydrate ABC transporter permease, partial [Thermoanaerobaculia bacterium]
MNRTLATIIINALLIATATLTVIPLLWMISASFMPTGEATVFPPRLLPSHATLMHYHELFTRMNFGRTFTNSMIIAVAITLFSLLLNS